MGVVDTIKWICVPCGRHIQNDWVEQQICIKLCIKLEHSSTETIRVIHKTAAMGYWWLAASSHQRACSCIMSHAEIFGKTSNHPGDLAPLQPIFGTLWLLAFPKTKITFERKKISDHQWYQGSMMGQLMAIGRITWGPKMPTLKGTHHCPMYSVSCTLYLLQ